MFFHRHRPCHKAFARRAACLQSAVVVSSLAVMCVMGPARAGAQEPSVPPAQAAPPQDDTVRFRLPTVTVAAQKEAEDKQKIPVSVTAVSADTIENADIHVVSEAAIFAPNTFFTEWSARKLSNARFRGISSSPNNPGITTFIDGVPQLSANSSSRTPPARWHAAPGSSCPGRRDWRNPRSREPRETGSPEAPRRH